jgi:hypothetical protein
MNLNLSLKPEDLKKLLPALQKLQPYLFGSILIAVFGYTAYEVNAALNVQPGTPPASTQAKITFDQPTINSLKSLQAVGGDVPTGTLGTDNPFN